MQFTKLKNMSVRSGSSCITVSYATMVIKLSVGPHQLKKLHVSSINAEDVEIGAKDQIRNPCE